MRPEGEVRRYQSGALPFTVDAYIDTYHGPAWVKRQLRGRSGWLQVSRARLETDISEWSTTIVAGVTDDGERLGKMTANAFLAMRTSGPQTCFYDPPEELADFSEMLFWDFLGRCDLRHLDLLEEVEAQLDARLKAEQTRGETVLAEAERYIAELRRLGRSPETDPARRAEINARVALMEEKHAAAAAWLVRHLAAVRQQGEAFEAQAMSALENHGEVEELYSIHWVARSQYDRIVDRGLLRELTTTASLTGVPRQARLDQYDLMEIAESRRKTPVVTIEPVSRRKKRRPVPPPVNSATEWRREERELLAALEGWQNQKRSKDWQPLDASNRAAAPGFPAETLTPTTQVEPALDQPDDSNDVGALIESELAEMLKDLRPE